MRITVRDITINNYFIGINEFDLELPMKTSKLINKLNKEHEYIIVDHDNTLKLDEYYDIVELNEFLLLCKEKEITESELKVLSSYYYIYDLVDKVKDEDYIIIDFDMITAFWLNPDVNNDRDKGLCLFTEGYYFPPFDVTDANEDWIRWELLWEEAESDGWVHVRVDEINYLIK